MTKELIPLNVRAELSRIGIGPNDVARFTVQIAHDKHYEVNPWSVLVVFGKPSSRTWAASEQAAELAAAQIVADAVRSERKPVQP